MAETITLPALVDIHVHLREPSENKAETIESGTKAALVGGYALVADMPNNPGKPTWSEERIDEKHAIARESAYLPVAFYAGSQPESDNIGELEKMAPKAMGLKLYGAPTTGNSNDYEAKDFVEIVNEWHRVAPEKPILLHAGKDNLTDMIGLVAGDLGHHLHVCHINDPEDVYSALAEGRHKARPVTIGVTPHHLIKTSHDVHSEGEFARMQPPLAKQHDSEQLMHLLAGEQIDIVESDFAPHSKEAKWEAEHGTGSCYGVGGIEHIVPLLLHQVKKERLSMDRLVDVLSTKPAHLLDVKIIGGTTWTMEDYRIESEDDMVSGAGWTPYLGKLVTGKLVSSSVQGKNVFHPKLGARKNKHKPVTVRGVQI